MRLAKSPHFAHFHFQGCLGPSLLRSRKLITFPGTDLWERVPVYIHGLDAYLSEGMLEWGTGKPFRMQTPSYTHRHDVVGIYACTWVYPRGPATPSRPQRIQKKIVAAWSRKSIILPSQARKSHFSYARQGGMQIELPEAYILCPACPRLKSQAQVWD